jgi:prepilin-type N-terminal cleavage/methylation domain-containing protein
MLHSIMRYLLVSPAQSDRNEFSFVLKQRGFSLFEMLVVLAVIGVLTTMVVARYQTFAVQREVDTVARELAQSIEFARVTAQSHGREVAICPVTRAQLNAADLNVCPSLSANVPWQGWVVIKRDTGQVLMRSGAVPATVLVCMATSEIPDVCNSSAASSIRVMTAIGKPQTVGYTLRVTAAQVQKILAKKVILSDSGRVKYEDI